MRRAEIAVVGGGASGLMAALTAAEEQKRQHRPVSVLVLEAAQKPGRKLLATGNGRCNLTNMRDERSRFHGDVPAAEAVLGKYPPQAVVRRFLSLGLLCREEDEGRVYPNSGQAASVLSLLLEHLQALGVEILCEWPVSQLSREGAGFRLRSSQGEEVLAQKVILAASGKAAPQLGSNGSGYALAKSVGHSCTPCFPALVPVICGESKRCKALHGVRCRGRVSLLGDGKLLGEELGEIQFTDYGLSGVCVFQLSRMASEWAQSKIVNGKHFTSLQFSLDLLPNYTPEELLGMLQRRKRLLPKSDNMALLSGFLPVALARQIAKEVLEKAAPVETLSITDIEKTLLTANNYTFTVKATQDWNRAQVTAGGVPLSEICPQTLESSRCPGLYLCGEVLNIDGDCGGYNLQWAWASGMTAGKAAADACKPTKPAKSSKPRRKPHAANR